MSQMLAQHSYGGRAKGTPQARAQPGAPRKASGPSGSRAGGQPSGALLPWSPMDPPPPGRGDACTRNTGRVTAGIPACSAQCRGGRGSGLAGRFPQLSQKRVPVLLPSSDGVGGTLRAPTVRKAETMSVTGAATGQATRGDGTTDCLVSFVWFTCWASLATELHVLDPLPQLQMIIL